MQVKGWRSGRLSPSVSIGPRRLLVVAAAAAMGLVGCDHRQATPAASGPFVPAALSVPAGVKARAFSPPGLGVAVEVPEGWTTASPASGFDYVLDGPPGSGEFLLATRAPGFTSSTALLDKRRSFLKSIGATIRQVQTGDIGGHPAVKLQYRLPGRNGRPAVNDIEYDTLVGSNGAALVVVGALDGHAVDPALDAWITSTIHPTS